jgi:RNA polymerase sigma-70 factor (ECF subfamily)
MAPCFQEAEQRDDAEFDLVRRVQSNDQAAFRVLVERYQTKIFSVVYRILRNQEDAEDVAQLVFTKIYFAIKNFDSRSSLLGWMCRIAINECYSLFRKRRAQYAHEAEAPDFEAVAADNRMGAGSEPGADTTMAARDFLNKLLAHLGGEDRLLLIMKEVEGHSISELADFTGQSESAVKTKLFRARCKLVGVAERLSRRTALAPVCL